MMKVLITAGSTQVPIDKVRIISNIFKGKTGTGIAKKFSEMGCDVTLMTSSPELAEPFGAINMVTPYHTYRGLFEMMKLAVKNGNYDVIIHSAAVSDYEIEGMFVEAGDGKMIELDGSKKVSSRHKNIFMKLRQTEKIIDKIRNQWGFDGVLVKFKLEVGISIDELVDIARKSMRASKADFIVANCLEWANESAFILAGDEYTCEISRDVLPEMLYRHIEDLMNLGG